jgi:hypothetical protein
VTFLAFQHKCAINCVSRTNLHIWRRGLCIVNSRIVEFSADGIPTHQSCVAGLENVTNGVEVRYVGIEPYVVLVRRYNDGHTVIAESGADTPECLAHAEGISSGVTFREQAAWWIEHVQQRKRKPIAPATVESWRGCLDTWILPNLGDVPLSSVGNLALKGLVEKMVKAGLSPKTVNTYTQVVKSVVASAVNEEGEQLFPRKWNHEFVDMPVVDKSKQNTPHFTSEVVTGILGFSKGYKQMFCALRAPRWRSNGA